MADQEVADGLAYDPTAEDYENGAYQYDQQDDLDEDEDYDPSSFNIDEGVGDMDTTDSPVPAQSPAPAIEQTSQPKTVGGFIVDDEDEDEEQQEQGFTAPPPSQLNGTAGAQSGLGAVAVAEASQDVPPIASEAQDDTAALPPAQTDQSAPVNGSTPVVPDFSAPGDSSAAALASSIPALSSTLSAIQNAAPVSDQGKQQADLSISDLTAQSATATPQPPAAINAATSPPQTNGSVPPTPTTQRLPHDKVGQLEDRIKEDSKGDTDAWRSLITHYREKGQLDNARKVYSRFFDVFPSAASVWIDFAKMELDQDALKNLEQIFGMSLTKVPNVDMWNLYLDYLRRIFPLMNDTDGQKRGIISQAFDAVLDNIGIDPDAGKVWPDYIDFVKSGPGTIGGTGWQDAQKMDLVRKAYQRAIKLPHSELVRLWKEYDNFELGIHKANGRKNLEANSPNYMQARAAKTLMDQRVDRLDRISLPRLPPLYGCAGEDQFADQVERFKDWIAWEKSDPLAYRDEDVSNYRKRVLYAYKQATMQLRFYPQIWFEAASWCFEQIGDDMATEGEQLLDQGIEANPESVLLAFKKADRIEEASMEAGNTDEVAIRNGEKLDVPFETVHTALYALHKKMQERLNTALEQIKQYYASLSPEQEQEDAGPPNDDDSEEKPKTRAQKLNDELSAYRTESQQHMDALKRTISSVWVAKMRAFRRIQGQGQPGKPKKGLRGVFAESRPRGQLTSEVYIASAQMEWGCYRDASAQKIFERGLKLFPTDDVFTLEYIKHLITNNDYTNARAVFETTLTKISNSNITAEQQRNKCRPLLGYMHYFESSYGDLDKIHKLERRMKEMFPDEPEIMRFSNRFAQPNFDAMDVQLIISPMQALPKSAEEQRAAAPQQPVPSIEAPRSPAQDGGQLRLGPNGPYMASPKRALDDSDSEAPQRKFMRGDSPLKGAAGRRMQNQSGGASGSVGGAAFMTKSYNPAPAVPAGPPPLPGPVNYLLSIIPRASAYNNTRFDPDKMVDFLRGVDLQGGRM